MDAICIENHPRSIISSSQHPLSPKLSPDDLFTDPVGSEQMVSSRRSRLRGKPLLGRLHPSRYCQHLSWCRSRCSSTRWWCRQQSFRGHRLSPVISLHLMSVRRERITPYQRCRLCPPRRQQFCPGCLLRRRGSLVTDSATHGD